MITENLHSLLTEDVLRRVSDERLARCGQKLLEGGRLDLDDGLACLETQDLLGLGSLAFAAKRARFGDRVFYVLNHHVNYTNVCVNGCGFCAFSREEGHPEGYLLSPEDVAAELSGSRDNGLREVHLVGGLNPGPDFGYYLSLLRAIKEVQPSASVKGFTAVEIDHMAGKAGLSWRACLTRLKAAGLDAMPGGGAEVFSERVRGRLFPRKIGSAAWLAIHGTAHSLGIKTNATMLFGHMETLRERCEHLLALRDQQDNTGGFQAFIPLAFHPRNTTMRTLPGPTAVDILRTVATARLMLDNFPHIKAYWVMLGVKLAQTALSFGADDIEGAVVREKIAHEAGADTQQGLSESQLRDIVAQAGFLPVERNTFHEPVSRAC